MEYEKILLSRLFYSFLWTLALHIFPLSLYFLNNFDIVHPGEWIVNSTLLVFNIGTWVSLVPLQGILFMLGHMWSLELKKPPSLIMTRFQLLCSYFNKYNTIKLFLYVMLGIAVPWTYLNLNSQPLTRKCQDSPNNDCLDENSVFLMTCGIFTGVFYFIKFDLLAEKYLQFPIIRQLKFLQIRSKFPQTLRKCLKSSFVPAFYFFPFYMWYGKQIVSIFEIIFSATSESWALTSTSGLLHLSVVLHAWLLSCVYFLHVETLQLMIQIHFTEHYSFDLIKEPNCNLVLLSSVLGEHNVPIIQYLACYDLYILSMSQKSNRWQVFTLSQPGGHPHTWNGILHESIKLIDKFISEIEDIYKPPVVEKPKPRGPRQIHMREMTIRQEEIISGPVPLVPPSKLRHLVSYHRRVPLQEERPLDEFLIKLASYIPLIKKHAVIEYIFGTKPDARVRFVVTNSQPLIWVIQSLSELAANALMEDQFGIVLKDLPLIINTLLRLKVSIDKLGNIPKKFQKRDHDNCMKASLKSALRRSLYRIAIAYSEYLTDLPLPPENLCCMQSFVNFKES